MIFVVSAESSGVCGRKRDGHDSGSQSETSGQREQQNHAQSPVGRVRQSGRSGRGHRLPVVPLRRRWIRLESRLCPID